MRWRAGALLHGVAWARRAARPCFRRSLLPVLSSTLLMANVVANLGGYCYGRRLQVMTAWAKPARHRHDPAAGGHPGAPERARQKNRARHGLARSPSPGLPDNIPGSMALGVAVFCWICAQPRIASAPLGIAAAAARWPMRSLLRCAALQHVRVGANARDMHPAFQQPPLRPLLSGGARAVRPPLFTGRHPIAADGALRILFGALTGAMAATAGRRPSSCCAVVRLHLEFEMGAAPAGCAPGLSIPCSALDQARPAGHLLGLMFIQWGNYASGARRHPARRPRKALEYTSARWLDAICTAAGLRHWVDRVLAERFSATPQLIGCCDQGQSMRCSTKPYKVIPRSTRPSPKRASTGCARSAPAWWSTADEHDEYKDSRARTLRRRGPLLHRENGDSIYSSSPGFLVAHVVRRRTGAASCTR